MQNHRIVFRADGNKQIGLGHIYRCIALIQILKYEFSCLFITNNPTNKISDLIRVYSFLHIINVQNNNEEITALENILIPTDIFVADGYDFDLRYQNEIKCKVKKLVMIDDLGQKDFTADVIINHGGTPNKLWHEKGKETRLLYGFDYLILRKEFLEVASKPRKINKTDTIFICMGGADPFKITIKAIKASIYCDFIKKIIVVTGNAFSNQVELKKQIAEASKRKEIIYEKNINTTRMVELIKMCELAICPASTVALEVCCVKAGLLTGMVIDNQKTIHNSLLNSECCLSVGDFNEVTSEDINFRLYQLNNVDLVNDLMKNQSKIIDGCSDIRILHEFKMLCK